MQSSYKRLGDYIQVIKDKNVNLRATKLLGINIDKFFMPSVANIVGTDLSNYKIVKKNQFACNRMHVGRDYRIPIALSNDENEFIVSPAYDVFEIIDTNVLLPEYLMMWFRRKEFDRNTWFHTDADVRGGLPWEAFSNLKLPIPSLEKQQEIINEYHTIQNRINLNNQLIAKLEETAQTIYKQWFVDFEFPFDFAQGKPSENGKPYKSNGGKMVWCEELEKEIPEGWEVGKLDDLKLDISDGNYSSKYPSSTDFISEGVPFIRGADFDNKVVSPKNLYFISTEQHRILKKGHTKKGDILLSTRGEIGKIAFITNKFINCNINAQLVRINGGTQLSTFYLGCLFESKDYKDELLSSTTGSALQQLPRKNLSATRLLIPSIFIIQEFTRRYESIHSNYIFKKEENQKLEELKELLLGRMVRS